MLISIIIVNWNRVDDMRETLDSLKNQTYSNYEIVVVDNGSSDGSIEVFECDYPYVNLVKLDNNVGCEEGFNIGMQNSKGDIFYYLDSDASLSNDILELTALAFLEDNKLGILEPRVINPHNSLILNEPKNWPLKNSFIGCAVAIRKQLIDEIGNRPSEYFIYTSEADLCIRVVDTDYKIRHNKNMLAFHRESPKKRLSSKFYYYYTRNGIWLIWKFYPFLPALQETLIHISYNFLKSMYALAPWHFFRGIFDALIGFKKYAIYKRNPIKKYYEAKLYPSPVIIFRIIIKKMFGASG